MQPLIDTIPTDTVRDLRDRALIATLTYGLARVGAALKMRVEDLQAKGTGWRIRLHEKGGKQHMMPFDHSLAEAWLALEKAIRKVETEAARRSRNSPEKTKRREEEQRQRGMNPHHANPSQTY
jgi:site-specific recombinase XerD